MGELRKDDRRIIRTKRALAQALSELIVEKGYEAITVQDITDRANVGRSTFYAHYESKDELCLYNINFQQHLVEFKSDAEGFIYGINLQYLFNHLVEYYAIAKELNGLKIGYDLRNLLTEIIADKIITHNKKYYSKTTEQKRILNYKAQMVAGGIVRMLFEWTLEGSPVGVDTLIKIAEGNITSTFSDGE
ncbi:MAG: TetR/AcrR family transcriptional regulator [Bacteroidetes bacterium]|nr:MAG: TetR/AcrR family transcriptional regulator [Bacteroidota bacterium]